MLRQVKSRRVWMLMHAMTLGNGILNMPMHPLLQSGSSYEDHFLCLYRTLANGTPNLDDAPAPLPPHDRAICAAAAHLAAAHSQRRSLAPHAFALPRPLCIQEPEEGKGQREWRRPGRWREGQGDKRNATCCEQLGRDWGEADEGGGGRHGAGEWGEVFEAEAGGCSR
jgi:hypothetical protein